MYQYAIPNETMETKKLALTVAFVSLMPMVLASVPHAELALVLLPVPIEK